MNRLNQQSFQFDPEYTDINYEVMYHMPFTQLKALCQSNKYHYHLCQNKHFWLNKLHHDQIDLPTNINQYHYWIKIYEVLSFIKNYINKIHQKTQHELGLDHDLLSVIQFFNNHQIDIDINHIVDISENITYIIFNKYGDHYQIEFDYNKEWEEDNDTGECELINFDVYNKVISKQQLIDVLFDGLMNYVMYFL